MVEAGVFRHREGVELLRGEVVHVSPMGLTHADIIGRVNMILAPAVAGRAVVRCQCPLELPPDSTPEPDFAVVRARPECYGERQARAEDVLLLVEVSDSSRRRDLRVKMPLYAEAGIAEVWMIDVSDRVIRVYREPDAGRFTSETTVLAGGAAVASCVDGVRLAHEDVFDA